MFYQLLYFSLKKVPASRSILSVKAIYFRLGLTRKLVIYILTNTEDMPRHAYVWMYILITCYFYLGAAADGGGGANDLFYQMRQYVPR